MTNKIERRDFLRVLGWGGASLSVGACGFTSVDSGVETVKSYVAPEDFNVPGIGVYYASTCTQCSGLCGVVGRVRDGRVLKLEGNVASAVSKGKLCGLGQATVQHHYNPDRLRKPLLREGGALKEVSWADAERALAARLGATPAGRFAFVTGPVSGHFKALVGNATDSFGAGSRHVVYDPLSNAVNRAAAEQILGTAQPRYALDEAQVIVSFGADFLDTWVSPVHYAGQYGRFRKAREDKARGTLVQIEPRMTLTGANADRWIGIRPGTEGVFALGLAHALLQGKVAGTAPAGLAAAAAPWDKKRVLAETGASEEAFDRLVQLLQTRTPSLILSGPAAEGQVGGYTNAQAILALNVLLGNVGKTVFAPTHLPFPQLAPEGGDTASLAHLAQDLASGKFDTVFFHGVNPVYSAPASLKLREALTKASFKVSLSQYLDETAEQMDLVLPVDSAMEDWGTHLAPVQDETLELTIQQPLMERLYPDGTRSTGDLLLSILKLRAPKEYSGFPDYYAYLRTAVLSNRKSFAPIEGDDDAFWTEALSRGVLQIHAADLKATAAKTGALDGTPVAAAKPEGQFPFVLAPAVRASLRDGSHANLPWLQETPDPLTTIVWDSWAEVHPATAKRLGISDGDVLEVASASGSVKVQAYIFPGVHPDVIAVPLGQGHTAMGRYAKDRGVNPFAILDPVVDSKTGELALYATHVSVRKTGEHSNVVKDEGWKSGNLKTQAGRKLVATLDVDVAKLASEG